MASTTAERREELAERVARSLDEGIIPWQKKGLPDSPLRSATSGRSYSGLNALYLVERCAEKGYTDPRFITANEAKKNGVFIRKGECGVVIEYWSQNENERVKPRGYSVFNVEQLTKKWPQAEQNQKGGLEKAAEMLRNAGAEVSPEAGVKDIQEAIRRLTFDNAVKTGIEQRVHTADLLALRCSIASTMVMREIGVPVEHVDGAPMKSWARSIRNDPAQLPKAARDGNILASTVMQQLTQGMEAQSFQADKERAEAQRGQELASEAAAIPRGLDYNLPDADLSGVQENVIAATDKARTQVNDLWASASSKEMASGMDKLSEARMIVNEQLSRESVITSATPGRAYSGKIIGIISDGPDKTAVQAVADNHAILHEIRDKAAKSAIKIGEEANLITDKQGYSDILSRGAETYTQIREVTLEGHKR